MTTIRTNFARDAVSRPRTVIAMAGIEMPLEAVRAQITSTHPLVEQATRLQDGSRRMVSISEVKGMEGAVITTEEVFRFERTGLVPENCILRHYRHRHALARCGAVPDGGASRPDAEQ